MGWRRYAKPKYGMIAGFLLLVGVIVPAVFGLMTEKAMEIGTADLLDKSTNWDESNIANSTYFTSVLATFKDNETGSCYDLDRVVDSDNNLDLVLAEKVNSGGTWTGGYDALYIRYVLNKTIVSEKVDKIVVAVRIVDPAGANVTWARVYLQSADWGGDYGWYWDVNASELYNQTYVLEIPLDAVKKLKIQSSNQNVAVHVEIHGKDLDNVVLGARVELYDVKKVNASAISNTMLVTAGILSWVGAFAATPYWNPMKNPEHRNVRRVVRKVRRRRR